MLSAECFVFLFTYLFCIVKMKLTTSKTFEFSHASILFFKKTFDLVYVYNQQCWDLCSYFALLFSHIALNCFHIALNCSLIALHCSLVYVHWNYKKTGKTSRVRKKSRLNLRFVYKNMEYIFSSLANQIADIFYSSPFSVVKLYYLQIHIKNYWIKHTSSW